jgi:hypothetical protein
LLLAGAMALGLAGFVIYNSYYRADPPRTAPLLAETPAASEKPWPPPAQEKAPPAATSVPQVQPQEKVAEQPAGQQEPSPPAEPPSQPPVAQELGVADTSHLSPAAEAAKEAETAGPAAHQVAREEGLLKIVATYYPAKKEIGYDAIILANPRITDEDVIYSGQTIALPKVDQNNIITLGKEHFGMFNRYYNSAQAAKAGARLKELQLHYLVRETSLPGDVKVYRLFIGGYDSKEELKKALGLAEQK